MAGKKMSTNKLAKDWQNATRYIEQREKDLGTAKLELEVATKAIAEVLAPKDAKPGETFCVWCRFDDHEEKLLMVTTEWNEILSDESIFRKTKVEIRI